MPNYIPNTREVPIQRGHSAILYIDTQNYNATRAGGQYRDLDREAFDARYGYFFSRLDQIVIPNWVKLQRAFRIAGEEILYTVIQSLTPDGRDRSLDYKISGFHISPGSSDAEVIDAIRPEAGEIVLPKSSSSVFISTNIDYLLRNLNVRSLVIVGLLTDQCIDSAVRDACDLGYLVTIVTDACATHSAERHNWALRNNAGYARQITTATMIAELAL
jgi:ureidoacrylate peracid hydrolase